MLCFRSESEVDAWCERRAIRRGAVMSLEQTWNLARVWYADRASPDWRGRTPAEAEEVVRSVGLVGDFVIIVVGIADIA